MEAQFIVRRRPHSDAHSSTVTLKQVFLQHLEGLDIGSAVLNHFGRSALSMVDANNNLMEALFQISLANIIIEIWRSKLLMLPPQSTPHAPTSWLR